MARGAEPRRQPHFSLLTIIAYCSLCGGIGWQTHAQSRTFAQTIASSHSHRFCTQFQCYFAFNKSHFFLFCNVKLDYNTRLTVLNAILFYCIISLFFSILMKSFENKYNSVITTLCIKSNNT